MDCLRRSTARILLLRVLVCSWIRACVDCSSSSSARVFLPCPIVRSMSRSMLGCASSEQRRRRSRFSRSSDIRARFSAPCAARFYDIITPTLRIYSALAYSRRGVRWFPLWSDREFLDNFRTAFVSFVSRFFEP